MIYMRGLIATVVLLISFAASAGGSLVGNGGGGILDSAKIYVLDLYEAGTAKNPYFDKSIVLPEESRRMNLGWESDVEYDHLLLALKIEELNQRFDGLGDIIVEAFKFFKVTFATEPLALLCGDQQAEPCAPGEVQLAVRRYRTIYLDRQRWRQLDEEQKVALLIHEGIYSFAYVSCNKSGLCLQNSRAVRPIVGRLFAQDRTRDSEVLSLIRQRLNIGGLQLRSFDGNIHLTISIWPFTGTSESIRWSGPVNSPDLTKTLKEFCAKNFETGMDQWIAVDGERQIRSTGKSSFEATFGTQWAFFGFIQSLHSSRLFEGSNCERISQDVSNWTVWH